MIDDDAIETMELFKRTFILAFTLDRDELNYIAGKMFNEKLMAKELKLIFAASDSETYTANKMDPYLDAILRTRPKIKDLNDFIENYQDTVELEEVV